METIVAQVGEEPDRIHHWAQHRGYRVSKSRGDPVLSLARVLVKAGFDPARPYETRRGEMPCLRFKSLGAAAGLMVDEPDRGGMRFRKYLPHPMALSRLGRVA
jgi:hypothetical protein